MRIVRLLIILMTSFFLVGCEDEPERTMPSVMLSEQEMIDVMTDIQVMENSINIRKNNDKQTTYLRTKGFDTIFAHHGITDSVFIENFNYYSEEPETMLRLMDSVVAQLNRMKIELENDSIQSSPSQDQ